MNTNNESNERVNAFTEATNSISINPSESGLLPNASTEARATKTENPTEVAPQTGGVSSPVPCSARLLSLEPVESSLVLRGYDTDEYGNPKLSKKEVQAIIQYLQYWVNDDLVNLPRWNVETEKWEGRLDSEGI